MGTNSDKYRKHIGKHTDKNIDTWEAMVNGEWLVLSQIIVIDVLSLKMGGRGG
jgi:hypothetical protein